MLIINKAHRKCLNTETCELKSPDQRKSMFKNSPFRGRFYTNGLHFLHGPTAVKVPDFENNNNFVARFPDEENIFMERIRKPTKKTAF